MSAFWLQASAEGSCSSRPEGRTMGRSEQISQDLVKDGMHVVGKGEEVVCTVMTKLPAGAAGGWEGNS